MRNLSGPCVSNNEAINELIQTLLPLPVDPAINRCGRVARSKDTGSPPVSWPNAIGNPPLCVIFTNWSELVTKLSGTFAGDGFGTSSPMMGSPGTGASILIYGVCRARAKSFSLLTML